MSAPAEWATPEALERLRAMWRAGKSLATIAAALRVSKNAVVGKVHRMPELVGRPSPVRGDPARPRSPPIHRAPNRPRSPPPPPMPAVIAIAEPDEPDDLPGRPGAPRPWPAHGSPGCQWLYAEGGVHQWCPEPAETLGGSWCMVHRRVVYVRTPHHRSLDP